MLSIFTLGQATCFCTHSFLYNNFLSSAVKNKCFLNNCFLKKQFTFPPSPYPSSYLMKGIISLSRKYTNGMVLNETRKY